MFEEMGMGIFFFPLQLLPYGQPLLTLASAFFNEYSHMCKNYTSGTREVYLGAKETREIEGWKLLHNISHISFYYHCKCKIDYMQTQHYLTEA